MSKEEQRDPNQPKFKFGDKVMVNKSPSCCFKVKEVKLFNGRFLYNTSPAQIDWVEEHDLVPYPEPQKKKLYAYKIKTFGKAAFGGPVFTLPSWHVAYFHKEVVEVLGLIERMPDMDDIDYPRQPGPV